MGEVNKDTIKSTIKILMQLDELNLLLIAGGAQMLLTKQEIEANENGR